MPIWVLGLICLVIAFFALGLHRRRKPDIEGVRAAMEAQQARQLARRLKLLRAEDRGYDVVDSIFSSRLNGLESKLATAVTGGFCARNDLRQARSELENGIAIIETAISDGERVGSKPTCPADVLEFLKSASERLERQYVRKTIALSRCCDDIRACENNIRAELRILSQWAKGKSQAAQERAAELIAEMEQCLSAFQKRIPTLIAESHIQLQGIEEKKVTAGVIKWRQERLAARQVIALGETRGLAGGFGFPPGAFLNPLARPPVED